MDIESTLRERRKQLVLAAEDVARHDASRLPDRSQLSRLISICGEATCVEEISNYLRYQASRKRPPWSVEFATLVIENISPVLDKLTADVHKQPEPDQDRARVAAWRLYAVFLSRALTYVRAAKGGAS